MFVSEQTAFRRMFRWAFMLAGAIIAWSSCDTGLVLASCGDYVMTGGHSHHAEHPLPGVPNCNGPHCQKQAPIPLGPTKGVVDAPSFDAAFWCSITRSARPAVSGCIYDEALSLADGHALPLLRPPSL